MKLCRKCNAIHVTGINITNKKICDLEPFPTQINHGVALPAQKILAAFNLADFCNLLKCQIKF